MKKSFDRSWFLPLLIVFMSLIIAGVIIYRKSTPAVQIGPNGENPEFVARVKEMLSEPKSFQHLQTIKVGQRREFGSYVMKFKCSAAGRTGTYNAYATVNDKTGEVLECKILQNIR